MDRSIGQLRDHLGRTGLRANTLLWYCGDNGTPEEAVATVPFRAQKGSLYEGGIRVPGVIEWPEKISRGRITDVNAVTSDILPTLCDLAGRPLPRRPLDGLSLRALLDGTMTERAAPICFWDDPIARHPGAKPYLDPELQKGTTPLVKLDRGGSATRDFQNFQHREILPQDFAGPRAVVDNRYKLVVDGTKDSGRELFDLRADPAEKNNLIAAHPAEAEKLAAILQTWQRSVLESLTGADYR